MSRHHQTIQDPGRYVTVKSDRQCHHCQKIIHKKTRCFTQSIVVRENKKPKRKRVWTCIGCPIPNKQLPKDLYQIMEAPYEDPFDPYLTPFDAY